MPGNMLRARKKDVSLKPNRVLDKRGSRGMLYENEELRIRTIHINDEVEKGHNDIKKLKKENEHLKREVWNLRDEYEKLEEMMTRMCATYGNPDESPPEGEMLDNPNASNGAGQKYRYKNYRRESEATTSASMYDSEDEELESMLMIDEDGRSYDSASLMGLPIPSNSTNDQLQFSCNQASPEDDSFLDNPDQGATSSLKTNQYPPAHYHHLWQHLTSVPPDLEVVKEESENTSNSNTQSPLQKSGLSSPNGSNNGSSPGVGYAENPYPGPSTVKFCTNDMETPPTPSGNVGNPFFNPKIEITPAGSPSPSSSQGGKGPSSGTGQGNAERTTTPSVQNLGCVTLIPKKFQVTSQLRISNPDSAGTAASNQYEQEGEDGNATNLSNSSEFQPNPIPPCRRRFLPNPSKRRGSQSVPLSGKGEEIRGQTLSFPSVGGLLAQPLSSFYQSEPSLSLNMTNSSPKVYLSYEDCERNFDGSTARLHSPQSFRPNPNYLPVELSSTSERYVVIGYIDLKPNPGANYEQRDLRAQDIIDELETQFDSILEQIVGVRIVGGGKNELDFGSIKIFISATNQSAINLLVEKGLKLNSYPTPVRLMDVTAKCSLVTLSGLPSGLTNSTIAAALTQYGQLVGPLERRSYKGVDISERVARMHLMSGLPSVVNIAGYQVLAKTSDECQGIGMDLESANSTHPQQPPPPPQPKPPSPIVVRRSPLTNSMSLDRIPSVTHRGHSPNVTCQEDTNRMRLMETGTVVSFVQPSSPSLSRRTNLSLNAVNVNTNTNPAAQSRGGHRVVGRAVSSAPRLESIGGGGNPGTIDKSLLVKRRMSTCSEISEENVRGGQSHSSRVEQGGSLEAGGSGNPNPKRPLSRLLRSSPGSLIPPDSPHVVVGNGAKSFYRSLPFDPRRNSNASRCHPVTGESGVGMEHGNTSGNRLLQSQMSHQSQLEAGRMRMGFGKQKNDPQAALPWCGCWGNGCI